MYTYGVCTNSDIFWANQSAGQCLRCGNHGDIVGASSNQSSDGRSGVTGASIH